MMLISLGHTRHMPRLIWVIIGCITVFISFLTHCILGNFSCILSSADFFSKLIFQKNSFRNTIRMSNSLDPDQVRQIVGPDLGPNCLPKLSADDTGRQRVTPKSAISYGMSFYQYLTALVYIETFLVHIPDKRTLNLCSSLSKKHIILWCGLIVYSELNSRSVCGDNINLYVVGTHKKW